MDIRKHIVGRVERVKNKSKLTPLRGANVRDMRDRPCQKEAFAVFCGVGVKRQNTLMTATMASGKTILSLAQGYHYLSLHPLWRILRQKYHFGQLHIHFTVGR